MQRPGRKCFGAFLTVIIVWLLVTGISVQLNKGSTVQENAEDAQWINSSKSWINRQICRWLGLCGLAHLNRERWTWDDIKDELPRPPPFDAGEWWMASHEDPLSWSHDERAQRQIPQYVFDHAPYVHLFSGEQFWPCDIAEHLVHTPPFINYTKIRDLDDERNLTNLDELNRYEGGRYGKFLYLQSEDNVEERPRPKWLGGAHNIPVAPEREQEVDDDDDNNDDDDLFRAATTEDQLDYSPPLTPSTNGRCGGDTRMTCEGSGFGQCCSIYGWCGKSDDFCGGACDAMAGECTDPFQPIPEPHQDLKRRDRDLRGDKNRPDPVGKSSAPVILVVVPKENGIVDAFWFFFYSFNLGQKVLSVRFGNHVGDWEHTLVRFRHGKPDTVYLSEHNFGDAYAWHALEKYIPDPSAPGRMLGSWSNTTAIKRRAKRPVVYSARGTHAMYAKPGLHPYILPWGLLHDQTDRGPLWDPSLNVQSYTWNLTTLTARASTRNPKAPVGWFHYAGHWGDKFYPLSDPRQYRIAGQYHYVNGPVGPRFKRLGRKNVCQSTNKECHIRHWATDGRPGMSLPSAEEEDFEEGGLPGGNYTEDAQ